METAPLKSFATWARRELITQVSARLTAVLAPSSPERVENQRAVAMLERDIAAAGGGAKGKHAIADKVAYTWFNRIIALRFMDANGYTGIGVVSPAHGQQVGQPEILADAKRGSIDPAVITNNRTLDAITGLLDGTRPSANPQGEAYTLLLAEYCRYWNRSMPFMFEREGDYTELLIPANLLAADSILTQATAALTEEVCREVEVIGWLYQFYISERKQEVFDGFTKGKKAGAAEIPAATQLFTPHWIVRYLVENSVGRLWMLNHPASGLVDQMDYYIAPIDNEGDFLKVASPEELTVIDPACGSGHMLTYAFDLLYAIYEEEGYTPSEIPELILTHNLYGTEIDPRAGALAAFALTMKARDRQRTFFGRGVAPSICVLESLSFSSDELDYLFPGRTDRHDVERFLNQFANADTFGALVRPDHALTERLQSDLATTDGDGDILLSELAERAGRVVEQAAYLSPRYATLVANPPYMGSGNMGASLAQFAARHFKTSKYDLFAMFIERSFGLVRQGGYSALVTMEAWMTGARYARFRAGTIFKYDLQSLIHMPYLGKGRTAMGINFGITAMVLRRSTGYRTRSVFQCIRHFELDTHGVPVTFPVHNEREAIVSLDSFTSIPGQPIIYAASREDLAALSSRPKVGDVLTTREGLTTGDNDRFMRRWFEVSQRRVSLPTDIDSERFLRRRWYAYVKGGEFRRWYGNIDFVVDWEHDGQRVKSNIDPATKRIRSHNYNGDFAHLEGLTWSGMSSSKFSARFVPAGHMFDAKGPMGFAADHIDLLAVLAVLNSNSTDRFLSMLAPNLDFKLGHVLNLPLPASVDVRERLAAVASEAVGIAKALWDSAELSLEFEDHPLVVRGAGRLEEHLARVNHARDESAAQLRDFRASVDNILDSKGADSVRAGQDDEDEFNEISQAEHVRSLVSYSVGCMFGRYSLDEPGLILADQGATVQDYLAKVPQPTFVPDADNVLPIVDGDWFEDDIVARFREFLRAAFGEEHFEENLRFVEESLGVKALREYFVTRAGRSKFYDDHVKRYKKRPIFWLFSSPKGSFNALIYMHRYTPSMVSTVLNEYLREFESKLEANLQHQERLAAGDGTPREKAAALKESERLRKVLLELGEYEHDVLYPLASQQIAIDLDDGVKVNYPRFYPALKKIAGLEAADE